MDIEQTIVAVLTSLGFQACFMSYKQETNKHTHWITFFSDGTLQMYAYLTDDEDLEKVYDTGYVLVDIETLKTLVNVFLTNHN